jgi:hypothetical protein
MIARRIVQCRTIVSVNTQRLRARLMRRLEEIFDIAHAMAKDANVDLSVRNKWAQIATYAAQTINSLAKGFDEQQINSQLDELEELVSEARAKTKARKAQGEVAGTGAAASSQGPG